MRKEDQPPPEIWLDTEALNEHFERVTARYERGATRSDASDEEWAPLDQNELTRSLRG